MAKNPASFQKRQRELDKKRKQDDKRRRRESQKNAVKNDMVPAPREDEQSASTDDTEIPS